MDNTVFLSPRGMYWYSKERLCWAMVPMQRTVLNLGGIYLPVITILY